MKQRLSQEGLKGIACLTMLLDHIGAVLVLELYYASHGSDTLLTLYYLLRILGRLAFPIYCFLLVEGFAHTRNEKKYALRLAIGALLAELPFDLAFSGGLDWGSNSVMVTLLLGCLMLMAMDRVQGVWKVVVILPFYLLAELLQTDYAGKGIAIIAMFALTQGMGQEKPLRILGLTVLMWFGAAIRIGAWEIPIQLFGLAALVPIFCYSGRKATKSPVVQWMFYLFYPAHLLALYGLLQIIG